MTSISTGSNYCNVYVKKSYSTPYYINFCFKSWVQRHYYINLNLKIMVSKCILKIILSTFSEICTILTFNFDFNII